MAGTFSVAAKNLSLDALAVSHVSIHTADPGTTGAALVTGTKVAATYGAAVNGSRALSSPVTTSIPGGSTISHYGVWAGATFLYSDILRDAGGVQKSETYGGDGQYTLTTATLSVP